MGIGSTVQELRRGQKLSRERLAAAANVSSSTIDRLELEDRVPKLGLLRRIATALDVPLSALVEAADIDAAEAS